MNRWKKRLQRMKSCDYWVIAWRKRKGGRDILHDKDLSGFRLLQQKRYITQADPFLFTHQDRTWLFYEKQDLTDMKGTLWCLNLDDPKGKPIPVLEEPFHLSYPQVFRYGKHTYMIPETRNAGEVRLYRCARFPGQWVKMDRILPLSAVDTTVVSSELLSSISDEERGVFYAFTYTEKRLEIYLLEVEKEYFHVVKKEKIYSSAPSDELRPGGAVFAEGGRIYRPAQDCRDYYGQALIINEIDRLGEDGFSEHEVCRLKPAQFEIAGVNGVGIHTYNSNAEYEVIDILHREVSLRTVFKKVRWKVQSRMEHRRAAGKR